MLQFGTENYKKKLTTLHRNYYVIQFAYFVY